MNVSSSLQAEIHPQPSNLTITKSLACPLLVNKLIAIRLPVTLPVSLCLPLSKLKMSSLAHPCDTEISGYFRCRLWSPLVPTCRRGSEAMMTRPVLGLPHWLQASHEMLTMLSWLVWGLGDSTRMQNLMRRQRYAKMRRKLHNP